MRIITGTFKGRVLESPPGRRIRPATDRVKSTIFNMLQNRIGLKGSDVLDLFAGTGSLGFEAISRGARKVIFVDDDEDILNLIELNARKLGCIEESAIFSDDGIGYLEKTTVMFDLIFADPPYDYGRSAEIPERVFSRKILRGGGYLIIEHSKRTLFPDSPLYERAVRREFGNTHVSFFTHPVTRGGHQ